MARFFPIFPRLDRSQLDRDLARLRQERHNVNINANVNGSNDVNDLNNNIHDLNSTGRESSKIFSDLRIKMGVYLAVTKSVADAVQGAVKTIKSFDDYTTDLANAMGEGREEAEAYLSTLNQQGKDLKATTAEMAEGADSFIRQGKSMAETETLIRNSMVLSKVAKMSSSESTDTLTSAMNSFNVSAEDTISIVDKLTSVDLVSASSADGLAVSMGKSAGAAKLAGIEIDKLISMLAVMKESNPMESDESVGNAMKSILSRMNQVKAGAFIDSETGESLNDVEKVLSELSISLRDANGQFLSSEKILDEVGAKWSSFDSVTQRAVATAIAGTYQYSRFLNLMDGYSKVLDYTTVAQNSSGQAMEKFGNYEESLEARTKLLQNSLESLAYNTFGNEFYGSVLDATTSLIQFAEKTEAVKESLTVLGIVGGAKIFATIATSIVGLVTHLSNFNSALSILKTGTVTANFGTLLACTEGLNMAQLKLVLSSKALNNEQRIAILTRRGMTEEQISATLATLNLANAQGTATGATVTMSGAVKGLGASLKSLIVANPAVAILSALGLAVYGSVKAYDALTVSADEAKEKIAEMQEEYADSVSELENLETELDNVNKQIEEIQSKGKLTFTDKEELENLKQQSLELEKQLSIQEKLTQQKAGKVVAEIKKNNDTLDEDFDKKVQNYIDAKETLEETKETGLALLESGDIEQENYDYQVGREEEDLNKYYGSVLKSIEEFQANKQSILDKYSGDVSAMSVSDKELFDSIVENLNSAYEAVYSKAEYNQFVIEPIFDTEKLDGFQQKLTDYFVNDSSMDIEALEEQFGASIIEALRQACEMAGIELDTLLSKLYNQAQETTFAFAPMANKKDVNGAYEAKQKQTDQAKLDYYNALNDETKNIIIEAEIPESVKTGTLQEFKDWIATLQENATISPTLSFKEAWKAQSDDVKESLRELATNGELTQEALTGNDDYAGFLESMGISASSTAEEFDTLIHKIEELNIKMIDKDINQYSDALNKVKNGQSLTAVETANLIAKNESLAGAVIKTKNGYKLEKDALVDVMNTSIEEYNLAVSHQIKKTDTQIKQTRKRIKAIQDEIDAIIAAEQAYTYFTSSSDIVTNAKKKQELGEEQAKKEKKLKKQLKELKELQNSLKDPEDDSKSSSSSSSDKSKSTEVIDWIERKLTVLQNAIDYTKSKFENLYNFKAKKNNLDTQIKQTTKLLNAQSKAVEKYKKKANSINLSKNLKQKVQNGQIDGSLSDLIATYGEKTGNKIAKYQEWWDKYKDARQSVQDTTKALRELRNEQYQLYVDRADQNIANLDAEGELLQSAKNKNKLEKKKIKYVEQSYDYQIKIANNDGDYLKATELRLQKEKEILSIKEQILQNTLDENEALRNLYNAQLENATTLEEKAQIRKNNISTYVSDSNAKNAEYEEAKENLINTSVQSQDTLSSASDTAKSLLKSSDVKDSNQDKIRSLIKAGKKIPDNLLNLKNVKNNPKLLKALQAYNSAVDGLLTMEEAQKEIEAIEIQQETDNETTEANIRAEQVAQLQDEADYYSNKYNLAQLNEENAISATDKNKYEKESRDYLDAEYIKLIKIAQLNGDIVEEERLKAEWKGKTADSYKREYDNIKAEYDAIIGLNNAEMATIQAEIDALETKGRAISDSFYKALIESAKENKAYLMSEYESLSEKLENLEIGSDEWFSAKNDIEAVKQAIQECDSATSEYQETINNLKLALFDRRQTFLDEQMEHIDFMVDMLSHKELTSTDALGLTDDGFTTIGLWVEKMGVVGEQVTNAREAWAELQQQYADGLYQGSTDELMEAFSTYADTIRDGVSATEELKDSIKSLVKDAFDIQLDALDELIEKRKKAMDIEQDLYSFQLKVANQTKTINSIEKQIAALTGDASEQARMQLQKLNVELETAEQDLEEMEREQWYSDQERLLDDMAVTLEEFFTNALSNTDSLIEAVIKAVDENGETINATLEKNGLGSVSDVTRTDYEDGSYDLQYTDYEGNPIVIHVNAEGDVYYKKQGSADSEEGSRSSGSSYTKSSSGSSEEGSRAGSRSSTTTTSNISGTVQINGVNLPVGLLPLLNVAIGGIKGYATGGIIGGTSYTGDKLLIRANSGESVLTSEFTKLLPDAIQAMNGFVRMPEVQIPEIKVPDLALNRNMGNSVDVGDVHIHIDGSNIVDPQSFVETFRKSHAMQNIVKKSVADDFINPMNNRLGKL